MKLPPTGFEPVSVDSKSTMIDQTTPQGYKSVVPDLNRDDISPPVARE